MRGNGLILLPCPKIELGGNFEAPRGSVFPHLAVEYSQSLPAMAPRTWFTACFCSIDKPLD
jgi:hypothetical protein